MSELRLHLGCGRKKLDGYINCDLKNSDHDGDIRYLTFDEESADEILAVHVCEHFMINQIFWILEGWRAVLKPGGKLVIELPCRDKVIAYIKSHDDLDERMVTWPMYGDPSTIKTEHDCHKWLYSIQEMTELLESIGFRDIALETPLFHVPQRDMRFVAYK